jgi:hypothetical protein
VFVRWDEQRVENDLLGEGKSEISGDRTAGQEPLF